MAEPEIVLGHGNDLPHARRPVRRRAQPRRRATVLPDQPGSGGNGLGDTGGRGVVDSVQPDPPVERPQRLVHPSRHVSDFELRAAIRPLVFTPEKLIFLTDFVIHRLGRFNDAIRLADPRAVALSLHATEATSFELGDWGGVVSFSPVIPGDSASLHATIWDPLFMRRPALARAILRHAAKKWSLRRISALTPAPHLQVNRLLEHLGFTLEGKLRHAFVYNGQPEVGLLWGVLPTELS
jgi:hypothetical protein